MGSTPSTMYTEVALEAASSSSGVPARTKCVTSAMWTPILAASPSGSNSTDRASSRSLAVSGSMLKILHSRRSLRLASSSSPTCQGVSGRQASTVSEKSEPWVCSIPCCFRIAASWLSFCCISPRTSVTSQYGQEHHVGHLVILHSTKLSLALSSSSQSSSGLPHSSDFFEGRSSSSSRGNLSSKGLSTKPANLKLETFLGAAVPAGIRLHTT
mmetsp:Transcript_8545/g.29335  ORF Transcript_8545/g.29335 Transcript_8545/m.29335 type:complete len:213 (+) Transcript_8545:264-902(+)